MRNKKGIGLITLIIIIAVILVIGGVILFSVINKNSTNGDNSGTSNNNFQNEKINNIKGNIKLVKKYESSGNKGKLGEFLGSYFAINNSESILNGNVDIIDEKGNIIFSENYSTSIPIQYLGDNYFAQINVNGNIVIKKDGKDVFSYIPGGKGYYFYYKNDILYYSYTKDGNIYSEAYDLKSKKSLWKVNGKNPFLLENGYVAISDSNNIYSNIIDSKTGKSLIDNINDGEKLFISEGAYYKIKQNDYIEAYDYKNNKLSHMDIKNTDTIEYSTQILSNGGYIINEFYKSDWTRVYKIYDKTGKLLINGSGSVKTTDLYSQTNYYGALMKKTSSKDYSLVFKDKTEKRDFVIYEDGTIIELYDSNIGKTFSYEENKLNSRIYVTGYAEDGDSFDKNRKVKVVNLKTKENTILNERVDNDGLIMASPNNKYFILKASISDETNNEYYVYNNKFEKIYESEKNLKVVNDEWFIETYDTTISIININTKENKKLEVEGKYDFNNATNLVTYSLDGKNQWLYSFE